MTEGTVTRSWIEEPTLELRWQRRWVDAKPELVLQQGWRLRALGEWAYEREWRDVPVVEE